MNEIDCIECDGDGEFEYCLDCDLNVDLCDCENSSGAYFDDCDECNGLGTIEEDDD